MPSDAKRARTGVCHGSRCRGERAGKLRELRDGCLAGEDQFAAQPPEPRAALRLDAHPAALEQQGIGAGEGLGRQSLQRNGQADHATEPQRTLRDPAPFEPAERTIAWKVARRASCRT